MVEFKSSNLLKKFIALILSWFYGFLLLVFGFNMMFSCPITGISIILFAALSTPILNFMLVDIF
ncbi:MAG: hypothetical protein ACLFN8_02580 [Candidatus Woesearchaeota archaeon]